MPKLNWSLLTKRRAGVIGLTESGDCVYNDTHPAALTARDDPDNVYNQSSVMTTLE
jgi:hypothetical protein